MRALGVFILLASAAPTARSLAPSRGAAFVAGLQHQQQLQRERDGRFWPIDDDNKTFWAHIEHKGENYCADGKLLPEFYLLGAKNAGTTSLAYDLMSLGIMATPKNAEKEWNFFKNQAMEVNEDFETKWRYRLPWCPEEPTVLGDFSPTTLFTVPLPPDLVWSETLGPEAKHTSNVSAWYAPRAIQAFHSRASGSRAPKFIVLLREPVSRMQSEYYHTLPKFNCMGCMVNDTFTDSFAVNAELLARQPPVVTDWVWKSLYARHVEYFLQYFNESQFMFVPNKEYFEIDPTGFSKSLISWLGVDAAPWKEAKHDNEHFDRPPLDSELPPDAPALKTFQEAVKPENERLVHILAESQLKGAVLAGYSGTPGNEAEIRTWLENGW